MFRSLAAWIIDGCGSNSISFSEQMSHTLTSLMVWMVTEPSASHVTSLLIPLSLYLSVCLSECLLKSHIWLSNRLCNIMRYYGTEMSSTVSFIPLSATFNFLSVFFNHTFLLSFGVGALERFRVCLVHFFSVRPFVFSTDVVFICIIALFLSLRTTPLCAWDYELIISHLDSMLCVRMCHCRMWCSE